MDPEGDYSAWLQRSGDASFASACPGVVTNNAGALPLSCNPELVTFQFTTDCGSFVETAANFTVLDDVPPSFSTPPITPMIVDCDIDGNSDYNAWWTYFSTVGGAVAVDACGSASVEAATATPFSRGCYQSMGFSATARDECDNTYSEPMRFIVSDLTGPTFTTPPSNLTIECGFSTFSIIDDWVLNGGNGVARDDCNGREIRGSLFDNNWSGFVPLTPEDSLNVTFVATGDCEVSNSALAYYTIQDTLPPVFITEPSALIASCDAPTSLISNWLSSNGGAVATDTCSTVAITNDYVRPDMPACQDIVVTFTACDSYTNCVSTTSNLIFMDTQAPQFVTMPSNLLVPCDDTTAVTQWLTENSNTTDNCNGSSATHNFISTPSPQCETIPVTFTACDSCSNCVQNSADIIYTDNSSPVFIVPPSDLEIACTTNKNEIFQSWLTTSAGGVGGDNCATVNDLIPNNDYIGGEINFNCGEERVKFWFVDPCGNVGLPVVASFVVVDGVSPTIVSPALNITQECGGSSQSYSQWLNNNGAATATDDCGSVVWMNSDPSPFILSTGSCTETRTVTFSASDGCGNFNYTTALFTIQDTLSPTLLQSSSNIELECSQSDELTEWLGENGGAEATDQCSSITWMHDYVPCTEGISSVDACESSQQVIFTAFDGCGRNISSESTLMLHDDTPPELITSPVARVSSCDTAQEDYNDWLRNMGGATATDECQSVDNLIWTNNGEGRQIRPCEEISVIFTVDDGCGNDVDVIGRFRSVDTTPPAFVPSAQDTTVECDGEGNINDYILFISSRGGAVGVDCGALFWINNAPHRGPLGCGAINALFTAQDECGNRASTSASFTVVDTQAPMIIQAGAGLTVECDGRGNQVQMNNWLALHAGAVAYDLCSSTLQWESTSLGWTNTSPCNLEETFRFDVEDQCGNVESFILPFIITDTSPPFLTKQAQSITFECDGTGNAASIDAWVNTNGGAVARDTCQNDIIWSVNTVLNRILSDSSCGGTFRYLFLASDACGYSVPSEANVIIIDTTPPYWVNGFPPDVSLPCGQSFSVASLGGLPLAQDLCEGNVFVSVSQIGQDEFPIRCTSDYIITRTFTATDSCGNSLSQAQTIRILGGSGVCTPDLCLCVSCTPSFTPSVSFSPTASISESTTPLETPTSTKTLTPTPSTTKSDSRTITPTRSSSSTSSSSRTESDTPSSTRSCSSSISDSRSASSTFSVELSPSLNISIVSLSISNEPVRPSQSIRFSASQIFSSRSLSISQSVISHALTPNITLSSSSPERTLRGPTKQSPSPVRSLQESIVHTSEQNSTEITVPGLAGVDLTVERVDISANEGTRVDLIRDGIILGMIRLPKDVIPDAKLLQVSYGYSIPKMRQTVGDVVVDIELFDSEGNKASQLSRSLTICVIESREIHEESCMSFYDVHTEEWICEDELVCVEEFYCGDTDHLTSFALLLDGGGNNQSSEEDFVLAWVSLALVSLAILIVLAGVIAVEMRMRYQSWERSQRMRKIGNMITENSSC